MFISIPAICPLSFSFPHGLCAPYPCHAPTCTTIFSLLRFPVQSTLLPNPRALYYLSNLFKVLVPSLFNKHISFFYILKDFSCLLKVQVYDLISHLVCSWSKQVLKVKADDLIAANPDILDGVDDLMQLSYLNEPSVLYNLQYRYNRDMIYVCTNFPNRIVVNFFLSFQILMLFYFLSSSPLLD